MTIANSLCYEEPLQLDRILFWYSYYNLACIIDNKKERLRFYESIFDYAYFGFEPDYMKESEASNQLKTAWLAVQPQLDTSIQKSLKSNRLNEIKNQVNEEKALQEEVQRLKRIEALKKEAEQGREKQQQKESLEDYDLPF